MEILLSTLLLLVVAQETLVLTLEAVAALVDLEQMLQDMYIPQQLHFQYQLHQVLMRLL